MKDINIIRQVTKEVEQLEKFQNQIEEFIDLKIEEASKKGEWFVYVDLFAWVNDGSLLELTRLTRGMVETIADEYIEEGYEIKVTTVSDLHIIWKED